MVDYVMDGEKAGCSGSQPCSDEKPLFHDTLYHDPIPGIEPGSSLVGILAEQVGFEPTVRSSRTPVFKTGAFGRSATAP